MSIHYASRQLYGTTNFNRPPGTKCKALKAKKRLADGYRQQQQHAICLDRATAAVQLPTAHQDSTMATVECDACTAAIIANCFYLAANNQAEKLTAARTALKLASHHCI